MSNAESTLTKRPEAAVTTERTRNRPCFCPNVDIVETADELLVMADMPGLKADDVNVQFENGALTIYGKVQDRQSAGVQFLRREYGVGDFYRTFQVSELIDSERIVAAYVDGVLTLHLPKQAAAKPRKIAVQTV
jgi:HSP20 family protein